MWLWYEVRTFLFRALYHMWCGIDWVICWAYDISSNVRRYLHWRSV
jgi:hypothetical protein